MSRANPLGLTRIAELLFASRMGSTKLSMVLHVEGLANPRILQSLHSFGTELKGSFRPCAAVVTPRCPQYSIDPLVDPLRTDFPTPKMTDKMDRDFASALADLSRYFDIGYHGHFFSTRSGRCRPSFEPEEITPQFDAEVRLLQNLGHRPKHYAGGWWFISKHLGRLLSTAGFEADTSVNDTHSDTFGRKQQILGQGLGFPFLLEDQVVEIPSFRSLGGLARVTASNGRSMGVIAMHDYDLMGSKSLKVVRSLLRQLVRKNSVVSLPDLVSQARMWLKLE